ncbi:MAG: hypothetical protein JJ913_00680 [Rhizobiaceae bacterium]|nr:hypothetical protein [Rhizobiaceae bacterium]
MNGWLALDRMASAHGDGLNQAFRDVLHERAVMGRPTEKVVELAAARGDSPLQAGPAPAVEIHGELPENVVRFRRSAR